jgi:KDO2-lipid IV(A) lauroyltransferase
MIMKKTGFYIFYSINYLITLLPLRILYVFSDFFYLLIYYVFRYRRKVVAKNLRNSFPNKSEAELKTIERRFYRHLADLFAETLKATHLSADQMRKRFKINNNEQLQEYFDEGRDVLAFFSHYNNWEWLSSFSLSSPYVGMTVYKPLSNVYFDRFILGLRIRYGVIAAPMHNILREIVKARKDNVRTATAIIADQTPPAGEKVYWTTFLNQDTCFYTGAEKVAVMYDMVVVFGHISKIRRGYYEAEFRLITKHPREEEQGTITERYVRMLEETIKGEPEFWLWSHRRWKYKRKRNNG